MTLDELKQYESIPKGKSESFTWEYSFRLGISTIRRELSEFAAINNGTSKVMEIMSPFWRAHHILTLFNSVAWNTERWLKIAETTKPFVPKDNNLSDILAAVDRPSRYTFNTIEAVFHDSTAWAAGWLGFASDSGYEGYFGTPIPAIKYWTVNATDSLEIIRYWRIARKTDDTGIDEVIQSLWADMSKGFLAKNTQQIARFMVENPSLQFSAPAVDVVRFLVEWCRGHNDVTSELDRLNLRGEIRAAFPLRRIHLNLERAKCVSVLNTHTHLAASDVYQPEIQTIVTQLPRQVQWFDLAATPPTVGSIATVGEVREYVSRLAEFYRRSSMEIDEDSSNATGIASLDDEASGWTVADIREACSLGNETINAYAKAIGLPTPPRGGQGKKFRWPDSDALRLLKHIYANGQASIKQQVKAAIEQLAAKLAKTKPK